MVVVEVLAAVTVMIVIGRAAVLVLVGVLAAASDVAGTGVIDYCYMGCLSDYGCGRRSCCGFRHGCGCGSYSFDCDRG